MTRVAQNIIDRYFKGDRSKYVASMQDCLANHTDKTKDLQGSEKARANILTGKLQAEIADNQS